MGQGVWCLTFSVQSLMASLRGSSGLSSLMPFCLVGMTRPRRVRVQEVHEFFYQQKGGREAGATETRR